MEKVQSIVKIHNCKQSPRGLLVSELELEQTCSGQWTCM